MFKFLRRRRRAKIVREDFPEDWRRYLRRRVPCYVRLGEGDRLRLEEHVQIFLAEKLFEGCAGFSVRDEVRVTIAGHACLLILNFPEHYYPALRTVLVYPEAFYSNSAEEGPGGVMEWDSEERAGESWDRGVVILAWDEVLQSSESAQDGYNVVLHEFAHQLDFEDGVADGAPVLDRGELLERWGAVFAESYEKLVRDVARNRRTLLDDYAATDPAEFFAVATETFFELPRALKRRHGELYAALSDYYRQDPASLPSG